MNANKLVRVWQATRFCLAFGMLFWVFFPKMPAVYLTVPFPLAYIAMLLLFRWETMLKDAVRPGGQKTE